MTGFLIGITIGVVVGLIIGTIIGVHWNNRAAASLVGKHFGW